MCCSSLICWSQSDTSKDVPHLVCMVTCLSPLQHTRILARSCSSSSIPSWFRCGGRTNSGWEGRPLHIPSATCVLAVRQRLYEVVVCLLSLSSPSHQFTKGNFPLMDAYLLFPPPFGYSFPLSFFLVRSTYLLVHSYILYPSHSHTRRGLPRAAPTCRHDLSMQTKRGRFPSLPTHTYAGDGGGPSSSSW